MALTSKRPNFDHIDSREVSFGLPQIDSTLLFFYSFITLPKFISQDQSTVDYVASKLSLKFLQEIKLTSVRTGVSRSSELEKAKSFFRI